MAITTYGELQTAVANWLNRVDLTARIPEFVALAEASIGRQQQWFTELHSLSTGGTFFSVTANPMELPAYVRQVLAVWSNTGQHRRPVKIVTPETFREFVAANNDSSGVPTLAMIDVLASTWLAGDGPFLYLWPRPAGTYEIDFKYVRHLPAFAAPGDTNALLRLHPDVYLFGTLVEAAPYLQHDERLPMWQARYDRTIKEINLERERSEYGASLKRVRLPTVF